MPLNKVKAVTDDFQPNIEMTRSSMNFQTSKDDKEMRTPLRFKSKEQRNKRMQLIKKINTTD